MIDDGATPAGVESTILATAGGVRVLREGPVTREMLAALCFPGGGPTPFASPGKGPVTAPGQLAGHYAPAKPVRLDVTEARPGAYLIGFGSVAGDASLSAAGDPIEAAANLFDALHRADASACPRIAVAPIPEKGIGAAINDRLRRAAYRD